MPCREDRGPRLASLAPVSELILARHGVTDWNAERRFQGHADPPLNDVGRAQGQALAGRLAAVSLAAVYASDLQRSAQTAQIVADGRGLPVVSLPELRE